MSSKVDTVTPVVLTFALVSMNAGIKHTTGDNSVAARTAVDMMSNKTPEDGEKLDVTVVGGMVFMQLGAAMLASNEEKSKPVTEMILKGIAASEADTLNDKMTDVQNELGLMLPPLPAAGKMAGKLIPVCVCNGKPSSPKIDTLATDEAPTKLVNPGMRHEMVEFGAMTADGADSRIISVPLGGANEDEILTLLTFKFEHVAPSAELLLKEAKRTPVTEMVVKVIPAGKANVTVKVTFVLR